MDNSETRFVKTLRQAIAQLPYDVKICFAVMADEDQPEEARLLASGAVLYLLGPNDLIPDRRLPDGFADDAIVLWAVLDELRRTQPALVEKFHDRFDGMLERSEETVGIFRDYLGDLYVWIEGKLPTLHKEIYKGKTATDYLKDPEAGEFLYAEAQAFATEFELDDDYLRDHLRGGPVMEALRKRKEAEALRPS